MTGLESITRDRASSRQCLTSVNFLILINYCRPTEATVFSGNNSQPMVFSRRIMPLSSVERNQSRVTSHLSTNQGFRDIGVRISS
jgi:hypothetical protein